MMDVEYDGFYDRYCIYTPQNIYMEDILTLKVWVGTRKTINLYIKVIIVTFLPCFPCFVFKEYIFYVLFLCLPSYIYNIT